MTFQEFNNTLIYKDIIMKYPKNVLKQQFFYENSEGQNPQMPSRHQESTITINNTKLIKKQQISPQNQITSTKKILAQMGESSSKNQSDQKSLQNQTIGKPKISDQEEKHLQISQKFNNIIYHYCKFLIYFYFMKKQHGLSLHSLSLQPHQNEWINQATSIMNIDNFPSHQTLRNCAFLLHPNSLHFIFQYNKLNKITKYTSEQIKFYFFALLIKKSLLSTAIYTYICQYWPDIINLLNEWTIHLNKKRKNQQLKHNYVQCYQKIQQECQNKQKLQNNLKDSSSIAAFEITSYLKYCCDLFGLQISSSK